MVCWQSEKCTTKICAAQIGNGSCWTRIYKPIRIKYVCRPIESGYDEDRLVKHMMATYGMDNVRGGTYSQVRLRPEVKALLAAEIRTAEDRCFRCGVKGHFVFACRSQSRRLLARSMAAPALCTRCGRSSHVVQSCFAKKKADGTLLQAPPISLASPRPLKRAREEVDLTSPTSISADMGSSHHPSHCRAVSMAVNMSSASTMHAPAASSIINNNSSGGGSSSSIDRDSGIMIHIPVNTLSAHRIVSLNISVS